MYIYLELPEGRVPGELVDGSKVVTGITLSMKSRAGGKSKAVMEVPEPARGARSRLYLINSPIEEIYSEMTKIVSESLAMRSSMATLASVYGLGLDIPDAVNKKGWGDLARKVVSQAVGSLHLEDQAGKLRGHVVFQGAGTSVARRKKWQ